MTTAVATRATRRRREPRPPHGTATARWLLWVADHAVAVALRGLFLAPIVFIVLTSVMSAEQALTVDFWPNVVALGQLRQGVPDGAARCR